MDAKRLARAMLDDYGMKPNQRKFGKFDARLYLNKTLFGRARSGIEGLSFEESYAIETALVGIDHALGTGRVGGMITQHVAKLTAWRFIQLVAEIAVACDFQGDVPYWLNQVLYPRLAKGSPVKMTGF